MIDPHHLAALLSAARVDYDDPDCEHFECGHVVAAELARAELLTSVPELLRVYTAACAWRDAKCDGQHLCITNPLVHDPECSAASADRSLAAAIDSARGGGK